MINNNANIQNDAQINFDCLEDPHHFISVHIRFDATII
jgi:hypothetical protein